jgi:2-oxoglutarate dehydrogenase E2 component (dihydrolipoamide succinyltransferase)
MALIEVIVPQLSESVAEATLLNWHKKVGEAVARDENLIDIETDKVVLELPAPAAGVLVEVLKGDGGTVVAGELIGRIDTEGKAASAGASAGALAGASAGASVGPAGGVPAPAGSAAVTAAGGSHGGIAMPAAAKLLAESGLTTQSVSGSGRDGRVTKGDVLSALAQPPVVAPSVMPSAAAIPTGIPGSSLPEVRAALDSSKLLEGRPEQRVPMSRLRARIAERLLQSQATNAILTTFNEVNMGPVIALRNKYKEQFEKTHGVKLGFMSFFVKEQVQEEASFTDLQQKLKIIGTSPEGLLALDRDLLARPMPVVQPLPVIGP